MDHYTRKLLDEACALDDEARAEHARWEADWAERNRARQRLEEIEEPEEKPPQPRRVAAMDEQLEQRMRDHIASVTDMLAREAVLSDDILADKVKTFADRLKREVQELREEITALKSELESLRHKVAKPDIAIEGSTVRAMRHVA